jgi:16S rRNA (guanine527-N7)-methyltransferase
MSSEFIFEYFPNLSEIQKEQIRKMGDLYADWNQKINVVSRKDVDELYLRHVLHSLGIAKVVDFERAQKVLDVGTGGGFPGIPLAILFPDVQFTLVDAIGKKIKVVQEVTQGLNLKNVVAKQCRVEQLTDRYDFIVSRAVAAMPTFVHWTEGRLRAGQKANLPNGILYLKGGDLTEELADFPEAGLYNLSDFFSDPFFETKKVVYLSYPITS